MSDGVRFAGYAAIFDTVDRGGDVIRAGAFAGVSAGVPLLWQHRGVPVGAIERIATDARGLRVVARVDDPRLAGLVRSGAVAGLSIGYRARGVRPRLGGRRVRELTALELVEVSLVVSPMHPAARVHRVADAATPTHPDAVPDPGRRRAERRNDHG
ncbi:HK97 family phage prohead protease [Sphingomonas sp. PWP1-2]|uniref:HK97 family phage prohead protease n=1 Tax=Sphingomonas sp. PWP1-2 TaxID=2804558 RepID=UPI003CECD565